MKIGRRVDLGAGAAAVLGGDRVDDAVIGDEPLGDLEALAAGAGEPHHVPIVDHGRLVLRHEEEAALRRLAVREDMAAADEPLDVIDAAREAVPAGIDDAARHAPRLADGVEAGGDPGIGVLGPDIVLGADIERAELLRMIGQDVVDPGLRAAAARQHLADFAAHVPAELKAAIARRLADAEEARRLIVRDRFVGAAAQLFAPRGTLAQHGHQRRGAAQQLVARWRRVLHA